MWDGAVSGRQAAASPIWGWFRSVVVPACNEAERIGGCLRALGDQAGARPDRVVVWVNNSTDETAARARALGAELPFEVRVVEQHYEPPMAHAGRARCDAMAYAAALSPEEGVLLTTDADGEVAPDWMMRTLEAFARFGVGAVFGRALLLPSDRALIPEHLHVDDAAELAYGALLERIESWLDPDPCDPWPRHSEHSGASIAVTKAAWALAGGVPAVPSGEDRAFHAALMRVGVRVRHALEVRVWVSGRLEGRAAGGMAETIARRIVKQDECLDEALEPVMVRFRRVRRRLGHEGGGVQPEGRVLIRRCDLAWHHAVGERLLRRLAALGRRRVLMNELYGDVSGGPDGIGGIVPEDRVAIRQSGQTE